MLRTLAWAGLRVSEAAALDWDQIDLTPGKGTIAVVDGKGGKDRVVPVAEPLGDALLSYLELRLPLGIKRWVWQSQRGHRMTTRGIREMVGRYGERIGRKLSPHRLRAKCGIEMVRQGGSLGEIRAVLGHAGYDSLLPYTAVAAIEGRGIVNKISGDLR